MRAFFTLLISFSMVFLSFSQELPENVIVKDTTLIDAITSIENQTGYRFFFIEDWLTGYKINSNITSKNLDAILDEMFINTELSYYVLEDEKRIILLQNTVIYDELPQGFFGVLDSTQTETSSAITYRERQQPLFIDESFSNNSKELSIARIGKADKQNIKDRYRLTGQAINKKTGQAIPDLAIGIKGSSLVTATDDQGNFSILLLAGYNILTARAIGLKDFERGVIMYNDGALNLEVDEGLEQLDEVLVEADALKNIEEATTGTEEIKSEESKNIPLVLGERNILQVAQSLPGITSAGEGTSGINVRGGKSDQNLFLLDDAVIYNPTHFFGIFQALNPFTTDKVNIYKAAPPIEFGGRLSSVFDIETKDGNSTKVSGEASIGPVTGNVALEIPIKKDSSAIIVGARGAYADWILRSLDEESLKNSEAAFYDGIIKYHNQLTRDSKISATAYYSKDNFSITSDSLYNYSNRLISGTWDHRWSNNTNASLLLSNSDYKFKIDFDDDSPRDFNLDYGINETEMRYKLRTRLSTKHAINYGISTKYYSVNPGNKSPKGSQSNVDNIKIDKEQGLEGAIFIGDEFKLNDKILINAGIRYAFFSALGSATQRSYNADAPRNDSNVNDTISYDSGESIKTYGGPEARVSARYLFTPDFSIKASFNNSYQFLHTLSNNTTVSPIDTWKISDLNIKPQKGYQAALGLYKNYNDNMYELSVEGFYKLYDNVLDFKTGANLFLNENVETEVLQGDGKSYGVELLLKKEKGDLNGWLSYTYSRSFYRFDGEFEEERINDGAFFPSNFDKPHVAHLIANYRFTRRYSFSMNFTYQTGRPITFPIGTFRFNNADFVFYSDRNKFRIPDYYRLDLGINIEGNHRLKKLAHSFISIQVYNVLGRNNPYSVFFVTEDGEVKALQTSIFSIPVPSITYNIKF